MQIRIVEFNALTNSELHSIYRLRSEVFVVEQNCAYQDPDEKDPVSLHLLCTTENELAGYCRIIPPGNSYSEPSIGRVVVKRKMRKKGLGRQIMIGALDVARKRFGDVDLVISAQCYLEKFYSSFGFHSEGAVYDEDGIPHIKMRRTLRVAS